MPIRLISFALLSALQAYHPPCASSFLITTQWQATRIFPLQAWSPYPYHWSQGPDQVWPPTLAPSQPIAILVLLPSFSLFANRRMFVLNYNCHAVESLTDTGQELSQEISRNSTSFLCCWTISLWNACELGIRRIHLLLYPLSKMHPDSE